MSITNQNTAFRSNDLQVAKASGAAPSFSMAHKMGLVKMTMGTATVVNTITYDGNTSTEKYRSSTTTSTTALAVFDNFTPLTSSSTYYLIVRPSTAYTLRSGYKVTTTSGNPVYQWSQSVTNSEITAGKYKACTPTPAFRNFARLYSYTGTGQTYTPILANKKYFLECWGASGDVTINTYYYNPDNDMYPHPGKGGYTYATTTLTTTSALYVYVGSTGSRFNGGAWGDPPGADASHIATANGKLSALSGQQSSVLVVAGGAGGASDSFSSGNGGGASGTNGTSDNVVPTGGSSSSGGVAGTRTGGNTTFYGGAGSFGQGGAGWVKTIQSGQEVTTPSDPGGGGGGGWYGGGGVGGAGGGAGGSGHVKSGLSGATIAGNQNVPDPLQHSTYSAGPYEYVEYYFPGKSGKTYASPRGHTGNGYARITVTPYD